MKYLFLSLLFLQSLYGTEFNKAKELIDALIIEDSDLATKLLDSKTRINIKVYRTSALIVACQKYTLKNREEIVKKILKAGAIVDTTDHLGFTALFHAVAPIENETEADLKIVSALISADANVNTTDNEGNTPLLIAAAGQGSNPKIVQMLLEHGADATVVNLHHYTPTHMAIIRRKPNIESTLRIYKQAQYLIKSIESGYPSHIIMKIISLNPRVDISFADGRTALIEACKNNSLENRLEIIRSLLEIGADVNHQAKDRCTAIFYASSPEEYETDEDVKVVSMLLEARANLNTKGVWNTSVLSWGIEGNKGDNPRILKLLLDAGAESSKHEGGSFTERARYLRKNGVAKVLEEAGIK